MKSSALSFSRNMALIPPLLAAVTFLAVVGLYASGQSGPYLRILNFFGMMESTPPFLDTLAILAAIECNAAGLDVFSGNVCDLLDRSHVYGLLWLRLSAVGLGRGALVPTGLILDLLFLAGLFCLPRARSWREVAVLAFAFVSPASVLALERANNDLLVWIAIPSMVWLVTRGPLARAVAYALTVLLALLKFYPITLLVMLLRERLWTTIAIGLPLGLTLVAILLPEMATPMQRFRYTAYMTDAFGAQNIAQALLATDAGASWQKTAITVVTATLALYAFSLSVRMVTRFSLLPQIRALPERESWLALAGSAMLVGCFFAGPSVVYRAVHLLLVLPAVLTLWRGAPDRSSRLLFAGAAFAIVWCMWSWGVHNLVMETTKGVDVLSDLHLAVIGTVTGLRELAWWWVISVLVALGGSIVLTSPAGSELCARLRIRLPG
jgi:hypothetical protein